MSNFVYSLGIFHFNYLFDLQIYFFLFCIILCSFLHFSRTESPAMRWNYCAKNWRRRLLRSINWNRRSKNCPAKTLNSNRKSRVMETYLQRLCKLFIFHFLLFLSFYLRYLEILVFEVLDQNLWPLMMVVFKAKLHSKF